MSFVQHAIDIKDLEHIYKYAHSSYKELDGKNIFITGATGFFGIWILESIRYAVEALNFDIKVWILSRNPEVFLQKFQYFRNVSWLNILEGDICNFNFPKLNITYFIHAATDASAKLNVENPILMGDTIIQGTRNSLEFAKVAGVKKYLFVSSGAIYGEQPPEMQYITENYLGAPNPLALDSAYGIGKRYAENLCFLYAKKHKIELKIARCFAFVGPYLPQLTHFAIGNFINNLVNKKPIVILGDGSPIRSYMYAADLVIWLIKILCEGDKNTAYNVGSEKYLSLEELAHIISDCSIHKLPISIAQEKNLNILAKRYVPSTKLAQNTLGLYERINLQEAVLKTLEWSFKYGKNQA